MKAKLGSDLAALLVAISAAIACDATPSPPGVGEECVESCMSGSKCLNGTCHEVCERDADCESTVCLYSQANFVGVCLFPDESQCESDLSCVETIPDVQTFCVGQLCRGLCENECLDEQICVDDNFCVDQDVHAAECDALCSTRECGRPPRADCKSVCGSGGCPGGVFCNSDGICTEDLSTSSEWIVEVQDGEVFDGGLWDVSVNGKYGGPDPVLIVDGHRTSSDNNSYTPIWNEDLFVGTVDSLMSSGLSVTFVDADDWSDDDTICPSHTIHLELSDFSSGQKTVTCSGGSYGSFTSGGSYTLALWPMIP